MFSDPNSLMQNLDRLEEIERATLRLVTQALVDFKVKAREVFAAETDLQGDIGEDITEWAINALGFSGIPLRLPGKMDYKRARYIFHPEYAVRQALLVDSKAEKSSSVARVQTSQTSLRIRQVRAGTPMDVGGLLPPIIVSEATAFLTSTIFVKYVYETVRGRNNLKTIRTACLPNGMLQDRYNPNADDSIWLAGPDSPTRREKFRTRLSFEKLQRKAIWRVQNIPIDTEIAFDWAQ